jgi:hypothetical protein
MGMKLRIEFAAGVMPVRSDDPVGGRAILIGTVHPDTCRSVTLGFRECFPDRSIVSLDQALIPANKSLNRNGLWGGKC